MTAPAIPAPLAAFVKTWRRRPDATSTIARMKQIVQEEYEDPSLVDVAVAIVIRAPEKDTRADAAAIMTWLRTYTRFVPDPVNQQLLKVPLVMLDLIRRDGIAGGDCVDIAMLSAALALAVGINDVRFVAESYTPPEVSTELVHVYTIVQTGPGDWFNFDTQRTPAQADTHPTRRIEVDVLT